MTAEEMEEEVEEQGWGDDVDILIDDGNSITCICVHIYMYIYIHVPCLSPS